MSIKKIRDKIFKFLAQIRIYPWGFILYGDHTFKLTGANCREITNVLRPGDCILTKKDHYLGNVVIPGYWAHIGLYVGNNHVINMTTKGLVVDDILTFIRADDLRILRLKNPDPVLINLVIDKAFKYLEHAIEYDFDFDFKKDKRMSCTEFVDNCFNHLPYYNRFDEKYIIPDDFLDSIFDVIWRK